MDQQYQRIQSNALEGRRVELDEEEDSDEGMARNLLGIRGSIDDERTATNLLGIRGSCLTLAQRQTRYPENSGHLAHHSLPSNSYPHGCTVSVTQLFEPKFLEIFNAYEDHIRMAKGPAAIDLSQHLMALCLDHLVPFSCWARESTSRCTWIQKTLDDNIDLRPEVRNGLCMVFVYAFSAAKALEGRGERDMFLVLQEPDTGLGIVNKTSLKIYNDPFCFFSFLKACMSGLIDAGKLPENERLNQPKKSKRQVELGEELGAFVQMKNALVTMFNRGENELVKEKVRQILAVWQYRAKSIRNRRFATAIGVISNPCPSSFLTPDLMTMGAGLGSLSRYSGISGGSDVAIDQQQQRPLGYSRADCRPYAEESHNSHPDNDESSQMSFERRQAANASTVKSSLSGSSTSNESSGLMSLINLSSVASCLQPFERTHASTSRPKQHVHSTAPTTNGTPLGSFSPSSTPSEGISICPSESAFSKSPSEDDPKTRSLASLSDAVELTLCASASSAAEAAAGVDGNKSKKRPHMDIDSQHLSNSTPHLGFSGASSATMSSYTIGHTSNGPITGLKSRNDSVISVDSVQLSSCLQSLSTHELGPGPVEDDDVSTYTSERSRRTLGNESSVEMQLDIRDGNNSHNGQANNKSSKTSNVVGQAIPDKKKTESAVTVHKTKNESDLRSNIPGPSVPFPVGPSGMCVEVSDESMQQFKVMGGSMDGPSHSQRVPLGYHLALPRQPHSRAMKSIRFERVGASEWEMKESRIFNMDSLLSSTDCVISLVDESKFSRDEINDLLLVSRSTGFVNLQSELQQRRALIASWPKAEHANLIDFVNEWRREDNCEQSLINFWYSSTHAVNSSGQSSSTGASSRPLGTRFSPCIACPQPGATGAGSSSSGMGGPRINETSSSTPLEDMSESTGVVVYEIIVKVGFIIRASPSLNIPEDCWRVIYPRDLVPSSLLAPFVTFLSEFFPQLRPLLSKIDNLQDCVVKYCGHTGGNEKMLQPPSPLGASCYQTIGTMSESAACMIGRLDTNLTIHDFVLQF